jgi:hypothetical protein
MDQRIEQAQQLYWEIGRLREDGARRLAIPKLVRMAEIHEDRAMELLRSRNPDGWPDFYAAITAWGESGHKSHADRLIVEGSNLAAMFPDGRQNIEQQLRELDAWLDSLRVVPTLGEFAQPLPTIPAEAA